MLLRMRTDMSMQASLSELSQRQERKLGTRSTVDKFKAQVAGRLTAARGGRAKIAIDSGGRARDTALGGRAAASPSPECLGGEHSSRSTYSDA